MSKSEPFIVNITNEDIANEDRLAAIFSARWNCIMKKEDTMHPIDFSCWRAGQPKTIIDKDGFQRVLSPKMELKAWAETRVRDHKFGDFPTIYLALKKFMFAKDVINNFGKPCFFIVEWLGCGSIGYADLSLVDATADDFLHYQNVNYRDQKRDIGTVVEISLDDFVLVEHGYNGLS